MPSVRLLCLADSYKHNGRCVAGIRLDTGEWLRPVSPADDGTLSSSTCTLDTGRPVQALDVVEIDLANPRPEPHQPENWVIGPGRWRLVEELTLEEAGSHLEPILERGPDLLGDRHGSIDWSQIEANGVDSSLALVRTTPRFHRNVSNRNRLRAWIILGDAIYDLSITDMAPWVSDTLRQDRLSPGSEWYFTISLTERYEKTNRCHKLIAGGIEIAR